MEDDYIIYYHTGMTFFSWNDILKSFVLLVIYFFLRYRLLIENWLATILANRFICHISKPRALSPVRQSSALNFALYYKFKKLVFSASVYVACLYSFGNSKNICVCLHFSSHFLSLQSSHRANFQRPGFHTEGLSENKFLLIYI